MAMLLSGVLLLGGTILAGLVLCVCSRREIDSKHVIESTTNTTPIYADDNRQGYCVTWYNTTDVEEIVTVNCPYYIANPLCNSTLLLVHGPELDDEMCHHFNRTGPSCGSCINGTGPAAFSNGIPCADCSGKYRVLMLILHVALELFCVTLLYFIFAIFQLQITSSPLNVVVYFSQVIVISVAIDPTTYSAVMCAISSAVVKLLLTVYGIWNLDFFRYAIPPICVSSSAKNIDVIMFDYIVAFYPIILTVVLYASIELYDRGYKLIVYIWRPFQYCFSRLRRSGNMTPRESIINTFASFILLAYSKLLYTSLSLLYSESIFLHFEKTKSIGKVLFYDPTIDYFGKQHAPYIVVSFLTIIFLICLPPFLLLVYPTRACGRCLERCRFPRQDILQQLMDTFQGWYKDGTDGTRDYRAVSSLYMFLRVGVGLASVLTKAFHHFQGTSLPWIVVGLLHGAIGVFFLVFRPYKKPYMNVVDGTILVLFAAMAIMIGQNDPIVQAIAYLLSAVPLLCGTLFLLTRLKTTAQKIKCHFSQLLKKLCRHKDMDDQDLDIEHIDRVLHPARYQEERPAETENEGVRLKGKYYGALWSTRAGNGNVKLVRTSV